MAIDVVCGMEVKEEAAAGRSEYKGETYYFCSPTCKKSSTKIPKNTCGVEQRPEPKRR